MHPRIDAVKEREFGGKDLTEKGVVVKGGSRKEKKRGKKEKGK